MAVVKKTVVEKEVTIKKVQKVPTIKIELNDSEARVLSYILRRVGGCPKTSLRKHTQSLCDELEKAGYGYKVLINEEEKSILNGGSYRFSFADNSIKFLGKERNG